MSQPTPLLEELAAIQSFLGAARAILKDGHMPDIAALEERISSVCLGIQAADVDEQSRCLPELAALLRNLDECERDMRAWHQAHEGAATP